MKFHIVPHHLQLTEALQIFTEEKLSVLDEISADVQSAEVVLAQDLGVNPEKRFTVNVRLPVPGKDVYASNTGADLYAVIDGVQSKLARRLRKRKTHFAVRRQKFQRSLERLRQWGGPGFIEPASI
ncbi:MAG: lrtA [Chthoniobacteraceae bacterium]|nr:lrtA [Chthoniobacteraceae bacterium]